MSGSRSAQSPESIRDLDLKFALLTRKKEKQAELFKAMKVEQQATNDDTFDATFLDYEIRKMQSREDQVERNLEQLKFEAARISSVLFWSTLPQLRKTPPTTSGSSTWRPRRSACCS